MKYGFYCGQLTTKRTDRTFPLLIPENSGGFNISTDNESGESLKTLVNCCVLDLITFQEAKNIKIDVIDFSPKPKFPLIAKLKTYGLYSLSNNTKQAHKRFLELDGILRHRLQNLLDEEQTQTEYNFSSSFPEPYHILIINLNDFPDKNFNQKIVEQFADAARQAGFYIIAIYNEGDFIEQKPSAVSLVQDTFPQLNLTQNRLSINYHSSISELHELIDRHKLKVSLFEDKSRVNMDKVLHLLEEIEDCEKDINFLSVPIATSLDGKRTVDFCLGQKSLNHGAFIAGQSGTGKTTLLNNIIVSIAEKYSINEIQLYLIDFRGGVEFNLFQAHPNCVKLLLDNQNFQAVDTLFEELYEILEKRIALFQDYHVREIDEYNKVNPLQPLPRIILVIDEVHKLLENYQLQKRYTERLADIAKRGRGFGFHLILSTQELGSSGIDQKIMSQISLRVAFKLNERDSQKVFGFENISASKLQKYQFIYNSNFGSVSDNVICRANSPVINIEQCLQKARDNRNTEDSLTPEVIKVLAASPFEAKSKNEQGNASTQNIDTRFADGRWK